MESFAQVSAQRKLQAEREARARQRREEEEERVRKEKMATFAQEQQEKADWWNERWRRKRPRSLLEPPVMVKVGEG